MTADLSALADRVEREEIAPAIPFLWNDAAKLVWPKYNRPGDDNDKFCEFRRLYNAGAYLDAADMLRPEEWRVIEHEQANDEVTFCLQWFDGPDYVRGTATGPHAEARARCAAALRARASLRAAGGGGE